MATDARANLAPRKPKRRWRQFSISSLLLLTLVCAVGLALIVGPAERQRRAVRLIESLGGVAVYANKGDESYFAPKWLRQRLGQDYFQSVSEVYLMHSKVTDADLENLKGL